MVAKKFGVWVWAAPRRPINFFKFWVREVTHALIMILTSKNHDQEIISLIVLSIVKKSYFLSLSFTRHIFVIAAILKER